MPIRSSRCNKGEDMNFSRIFRAPGAALAAVTAALAILAAASAPALAEDAGAKAGETITLPQPDKSGGMPLMQALALRHSTRSFTTDPVSQQDLSNLLWAVWGINREDGRHTAPTAKNKQNLAVYAALPDGVWRYNPDGHTLERHLDKDIRATLSDAPLILLYAAPADNPDSGFHIGSLYQNAGLYCASAGLGSVVRVTGADEADKIMALKDGYKIMIVQPVGHPKEN